MTACTLAVPVAVQAQNASDSLSMRTGMTDWVDPVKAVPPSCRYVLYPSSQRGAGTEASCLVYLPEAYHSDSLSRFPVIYYLHGGTGNQREVRWLTARVDDAIREGRMEPVIIVSPQALPIGWYINANERDHKVISGPIEDVIIKDLIPFIDSNFRTVATPEGRGIEGFSMGGRGALMLAFAHPDIFGAVSSVAGAVVDWDEEPLQRALECTFGSIDNPLSRQYFDAWHPAAFACRNARAIVSTGMKVRMAVGTADRLYDENGNHITTRFHNLLDSLGIAHALTIVPGANHNPEEIFAPELNPYDPSFWNEAFSRNKVAEVPEQIREIVGQYWPGMRITGCDTIADSRGDHYEITLADGTALKFNEHFKWINAVSGEGANGLPTKLVHEGILGYLKEHGLDADDIRQIEKVPRTGYDVTLADGSSLLFNTSGELIKQSK